MAGSVITSNPTTQLSSYLAGLQVQAGVTSENMARSSERGAAKESVILYSQNGSITTGNRTIPSDPILQDNLQAANGKAAYYNVIDSTYGDFLKQFGTKETGSTLANICQTFSEAFLMVEKSAANLDSRSNVVQVLSSKLNELSNLENQLKLQSDHINQSIANSVSSINTLLSSLAELNPTISMTSDPSYARNQQRVNLAMFDLRQQFEPSTISSDPSPDRQNQIGIMVGSERVLDSIYARPLSVTLTSIDSTSGIKIPTISVNNVDVTSSLTGGNLGGLLQSQKNINSALKAIMLFKNNLIAQVNETHNLGTSLQPPATMTGTVGSYDAIGTPMTAGKVISGQGTLRIAIVNSSDGRIVDYKNITLQANEQLSDFIARINDNATYPYQLGQGTTFTASLTAQGQLQIQSSNANYGIALGSVGATVATLNSGAAYNATTAKNVSYYFGMNNLIDPTTKKILTAISNNPAKLAGGSLNSSAVINANDYAMPQAKSDIFNQLHAIYTNNIISFADVDPTDPNAIKQKTSSLMDYSVGILSYYSNCKAQSGVSLKTANDNLKTRQQQSTELFGITQEEQERTLLNIAQMNRAASTALGIINEMDRDILELFKTVA